MKKIFQKPVLRWFIILLVALIYWLWLFYMTQPATASNTSQQEEAIIDVFVELSHHRGTDKLYIYSDENCYMLDTGWRNENKSKELSKKLLSSEEKISVTFWEHFPRNFSLRADNLIIKQVTDLRNDDAIYWDVNNHNSYQLRERIGGILAGGFLSLLSLPFFYIELRMHTKLKLPNFKKRSKTNQGMAKKSNK